MGHTSTDEPPIGRRLYEARWRQGAIFGAPSMQFGCNVLGRDGARDIVTLKPRHVRPREKLVMISHNCDIISKADPYVEALICSIEKNQDYLSNIDRNSPRYFVLDRTTGLVAAAKNRLTIEKEALAHLTPEPWPGDAVLFRRFMRWLGRRYDRPEYPDAYNELVVTPVQRLCARLREQGDPNFRIFNEIVYEVRVSMPSNELPPYEVEFVLMHDRETLTQAEADAIDGVFGAIQSGVDARFAQLDPMPVLLTEEQMSLALYRRTGLLFLEDMSYQGDEVVGLEPRNAG